LNQAAAPDVILLARGGGSIEDLWAFNDERVVRAVAASPAPVVTGVGHETDFTLADFAADLRAPTPTAAAELVSGITILDLQQTLMSLNQVQVGHMGQIFEQERNRLAGLRSTLGYYSPLNKVQTERQRVDELERRSAMLLQHRMELAGANLKGWEARLAALNPLSVLERGFVLVMKDGQVVASKTQANPGDQVQIRLRDGELDARVMDKG
jgi:exodeoxyribonuclease VII large subunit